MASAVVVTVETLKPPLLNALGPCLESCFTVTEYVTAHGSSLQSKMTLALLPLLPLVGATMTGLVGVPEQADVVAVAVAVAVWVGTAVAVEVLVGVVVCVGVTVLTAGAELYSRAPMSQMLPMPPLTGRA